MGLITNAIFQSAIGAAGLALNSAMEERDKSAREKIPRMQGAVGRMVLKERTCKRAKQRRFDLDCLSENGDLLFRINGGGLLSERQAIVHDLDGNSIASVVYKKRSLFNRPGFALRRVGEDSLFLAYTFQIGDLKNLATQTFELEEKGWSISKKKSENIGFSRTIQASDEKGVVLSIEEVFCAGGEGYLSAAYIDYSKKCDKLLALLVAIAVGDYIEEEL